jgi:hypothetical protein
MVMMFVGGLCRCLMESLYYSYHTKPTEQEFFVSAQTKIVVKLLMMMGHCQNKLFLAAPEQYVVKHIVIHITLVVVWPEPELKRGRSPNYFGPMDPGILGIARKLLSFQEQLTDSIEA